MVTAVKNPSVRLPGHNSGDKVINHTYHEIPWWYREPWSYVTEDNTSANTRFGEFDKRLDARNNAADSSSLGQLPAA